MPKKKVITVLEFKVIEEHIRTDIKKMTEGMNHRFDKIEGGISSLKEQVALLHEGQTEIKYSLKQKIDREEFARLEMRVTRLENRTA